jgi:hypothetical protein
MTAERQFIVVWDIKGLEFCGDYTEYSQDHMWMKLQNKQSTKTFPSIMHLELRARANIDRQYEIYGISVVDGVTTADVIEAFSLDAESAKALIRSNGYCYYSDVDSLYRDSAE